MGRKARPGVPALAEGDAGLIKGMLARGDRQHDIAAWFGVNGGRIAEIANGTRFWWVEPAAHDTLPPQGPYPGASALAIAVKALGDPLPADSAFQMVRRRAAAAGIATAIGNHSFRATGITAYLKNGGTLEKAAAMANHASTRTTQLYDRRSDEVTLDEVERVLI